MESSSSENVYLLSPLCDPGTVDSGLSPTFFLSEAVSANTLLPIPRITNPQEDSQDQSLDSHPKISKMIEKLKHHFYYNPLQYSSDITGRGKDFEK